CVFPSTHTPPSDIHTLSLHDALPILDLAKRCMDTVLRLTARINRNPRPLGAVKNTAYAWRQMLFFLSLSTPDEQRAFPADIEQRDRKSTRLNSSHVKISYAVFCLKKK